MNQYTNPLLNMDYPDPDVIRVGDVYYMLSTTMYFFPGGALLKSHDLVNWEIVGYLYDELEDFSGERLEREMVNYSGGMWAPCLRYRDGRFYAIFGCHNNEGNTYLFTADTIEGPWEKIALGKYYHDCSLLFDDDGRKYLVYGNRDIRISELKDDLSGLKEGGLDRIIIRDTDEYKLGYEGSHILKIDGYYYVFLIHWPKGGIRTEACFRAKSLDDEFEGRNVFQNDGGFCNQGIAQGAIVDTPDGKWYGVLFRDHGAVGRIPVLLPVSWKDRWPVFGADGKLPDEFELPAPKPVSEKLYTSELFEKDSVDNLVLKKQWQWNHRPDNDLWNITSDGKLALQTGKISINVTHTNNILTQRMLYPGCSAAVTVDATEMNYGDIAGICALQSCYGLLGIMKSVGGYYLVKIVRTPENLIHTPSTGDCMPGEIVEKIKLEGAIATFKLSADFSEMKDELEFFYKVGGEFVKVGNKHKMYFRLDHFTGNRFGLFIYSTQHTGGSAEFSDFIYEAEGYSKD